MILLLMLFTLTGNEAYQWSSFVPGIATVCIKTNVDANPDTIKISDSLYNKYYGCMFKLQTVSSNLSNACSIKVYGKTTNSFYDTIIHSASGTVYSDSVTYTRIHKIIVLGAGTGESISVYALAMNITNHIPGDSGYSDSSGVSDKSWLCYDKDTITTGSYNSGTATITLNERNRGTAFTLVARPDSVGKSGTSGSSTTADSATLALNSDSLGHKPPTGFLLSNGDTGTGNYLFVGESKDSTANPVQNIVYPVNYQTRIVINSCSTVSNKHNSALAGYCENKGSAGARGLLGVGIGSGTGSADGVCAFSYNRGANDAYAFRGSGINSSNGNAYGLYVNVPDSGTGMHYGGLMESYGSGAASVGLRSISFNKGSGTTYGIYATTRDSGTGASYAGYFEGDSFAIYCSTFNASKNYAGYFAGNVKITDTLTSKVVKAALKGLADSASIAIAADSATRAHASTQADSANRAHVATLADSTTGGSVRLGGLPKGNFLEKHREDTVYNHSTFWSWNPDSIAEALGSAVSIVANTDIDSGKPTSTGLYIRGNYDNFNRTKSGATVIEVPMTSSWLQIKGNNPANANKIKYIAVEGIATDTVGDTTDNCEIIGMYSWARGDCYAGSKVGDNASFTGFKGYVYGKTGVANSLTGLWLDLNKGTGSKRGININISGKSGADIYGDYLTVTNDSDNINYAAYGSRRDVYSNNNTIYGYHSDVHDTAGTRAGYCFYGSMTGGSSGALYGIYQDTIPAGANNYAGYFRGAIKVTGNYTGRIDSCLMADSAKAVRGGGGSKDTRSYYIIAASNSRDTAGAQFVCPASRPDTAIFRIIDTILTTGSTLFMKEGYYNFAGGDVNINKIIHFKGEGYGTRIHKTTTSELHAFHVLTAGCTFENIRFDSCYYAGIYIENHNITVQNCWFTDAKTLRGIWMSANSSWTGCIFNNNIFTSCGTGIYASGSQGHQAIVTNNIFSSTTTGINPIYFFNSIISHNYFLSNTSPITGYFRYCDISDNNINTCTNGITITADSCNTVNNNLFAGVSGYEISMASVSNRASGIGKSWSGTGNVSTGSTVDTIVNVNFNLNSKFTLNWIGVTAPTAPLTYRPSLGNGDTLFTIINVADTLKARTEGYHWSRIDEN